MALSSGGLWDHQRRAAASDWPYRGVTREHFAQLRL
jgi:hypothetical protein